MQTTNPARKIEQLEQYAALLDSDAQRMRAAYIQTYEQIAASYQQAIDYLRANHAAMLHTWSTGAFHLGPERAARDTVVAAQRLLGSLPLAELLDQASDLNVWQKQLLKTQDELFALKRSNK